MTSPRSRLMERFLSIASMGVCLLHYLGAADYRNLEETCPAGKRGCVSGLSNVQPILGVMTVGDQVAPESANKFLNAWADLRSHDGALQLDSAHLYVGGNSSRLVGKWLHTERKRLASVSVTVATKVNPWDQNGAWMKHGLSADRIRMQLEDELQRLHRSSVDLLYLHAPDPTTPVEESVSQIVAFVREGKVKSWGLSNFPAWQVAQVAELCRHRGWPGPAVYQGMYNAFTRRVELELFPCLRHYGIAFYAYNILAGGLLTGKHASVESIPLSGRFASDPSSPDKTTAYQMRYWKQKYFDAIQIVKNTTEPRGVPLANAALRWAIHHSAFSARPFSSGSLSNGVLLGASSLSHLQANAEAVDAGPLPPEVAVAFDHGWERVRELAPCYFWPGSYDCEVEVSETSSSSTASEQLKTQEALHKMLANVSCKSRPALQRSSSTLLASVPPVSVAEGDEGWKYALIRARRSGSDEVWYFVRSYAKILYHPDVYEHFLEEELSRDVGSKTEELELCVLGGGRIHSQQNTDGLAVDVFGYSKTFGKCEECNQASADLVRMHGCGSVAGLPKEQAEQKCKVSWSNGGY